ncbi:hypothetical protein AB0L82_35955 [Nocardia sp. NPDC052001]|uniref:hypothetical protein n=1 Tax=Nocardia sp. NPDC052001 TaxID=3154853 RepID=UPI00342C0383
MTPPPHVVRVRTAPDLIATLARYLPQYQDHNPLTNALLLLWIEHYEPGWWHAVDAMLITLDTTTDAAGPHWTHSAPDPSARAIAIILDADADGCGDNGITHRHIREVARETLRPYNIRLAATYGARGIEAGQPVWSEDDDAFHGHVPPDSERPAKGMYLLPTDLMAEKFILSPV